VWQLCENEEEITNSYFFCKEHPFETLRNFYEAQEVTLYNSAS